MPDLCHLIIMRVCRSRWRVVVYECGSYKPKKNESVTSSNYTIFKYKIISSRLIFIIHTTLTHPHTHTRHYDDIIALNLHTINNLFQSMTFFFLSGKSSDEQEKEDKKTLKSNYLTIFLLIIHNHKIIHLSSPCQSC